MKARVDGTRTGFGMVLTCLSSFCFPLLGTVGLCSDWEVKGKGTGIQKAGVPEPALPPTSYVTLGKNLNPLGEGGRQQESLSILSL